MTAPSQAPLPSVTSQTSSALVPFDRAREPELEALERRNSGMWPALAGACGTALVIALGVLGWLVFNGDDDEGDVASVDVTAEAAAGPTAEDMELGAEQLQVMLSGMNLANVDVEIRESVLYLVGTVPTDEAFADAVLAAGALPSVNQVNFTELKSEQSAGFDSTETEESEVDEAESEEVPVSTASLEDRQALQAEIDTVLAELPINFAAGSAEPDDLAGAVLQTALVSLLDAYPGTQLMLDGYTDESGSVEDNLLLSQERAEAVKALLVERGIAEWRLVAVGRGSANSTGDEDLDRRVEIEVVFE